MTRAALAAVALAAAGCTDLPPYRCLLDTECAGGTCTADGFCAFTDPFCASGLAYDASAGELAGACVASAAGDTADRPRELQDFQMLDVTEARDDATPGCAASGRGRDIFFQTTIEEVSRLYIDTFGSDFRVVLSVHRGTCAARTSELACGTASCSAHLHQWSEIVEPGAYCVIADRLDDADPGTTLVVRSFTGDPAPLGRLGVNVGDTCDAGDAREGSCSAPDADDMTWFVMSCVPTTLSASTCVSEPSFDGKLQAYSLSEIERACTQSCTTEIRLAEPGAAWIVAEERDDSLCAPVAVDISAD